MDRVNIIAVGNGGYNIAKGLISAEIFSEHTLIIVDTNKEDLERNSENADKSFLVETLNRNKKVKSELTYLVDNIIDETSETVVVCATLGGNTGSKYAPLITLDAILNGKFVVSLFSMPFTFEGKKKFEIASTSRMQIIASTNVTVEQNNDKLSDLNTELYFGELDKPIIDTIKSILSSHSLKDVSEIMDRKLMEEMIPAEYKLPGIPLIRVMSECYKGISEEKRKDLFNTLT